VGLLVALEVKHAVALPELGAPGGAAGHLHRLTVAHQRETARRWGPGAPWQTRPSR
jgi:hypothetical protein